MGIDKKGFGNLDAYWILLEPRNLSIRLTLGPFTKKKKKLIKWKRMFQILQNFYIESRYQ